MPRDDPKVAVDVGRDLDVCEACGRRVGWELLAEYEIDLGPYPETARRCEDCFAFDLVVCGWPPGWVTYPAWADRYRQPADEERDDGP